MVQEVQYIYGESRLQKNDFRSLCLLKRYGDGDSIILLLYVDDIFIIGHDRSKIDKLKEELSKSFAMKDLGLVRQILGMKISRDRKDRKL